MRTNRQTKFQILSRLIDMPPERLEVVFKKTLRRVCDPKPEPLNEANRFFQHMETELSKYPNVRRALGKAYRNYITEHLNGDK